MEIKADKKKCMRQTENREEKGKRDRANRERGRDPQLDAFHLKQTDLKTAY